jgi:phosphomannomutase
MSHQFNPSILREYDIRGIIGDTLSEADAYAIGRIYPQFLKIDHPKIAVCYDGRLSSPMLEEALIKGLTSSGADVIRVGVGPTPMLYYAVFTQEADGGIMITGSHNPANYNGFKMLKGRKALFGHEIKELGEIAKTGFTNKTTGNSQHFDIIDDYCQNLLKNYQGPTDLKIAWDPGNGAAGDIVSKITRTLPGEHILINEKIDGTFPAHHPDPSDPENLVQLRAVVLEHQCDIGFAFDGDGDRLGVIDSMGNILNGDQIIALLATPVLQANPGAPIIADVKTSQMVFDHIAKHGGKPVMWKTGHSLVKAKMTELNAPFGGEMSGHLFFADRYFGFDDGIYAALRFMELLDQPLHEKVAELAEMASTPEIRFECSDERKFKVVDEVKSHVMHNGASIVDIDGIRVIHDGGWWLLRASNTQASLVVRCEATNEKTLMMLKEEVKKYLGESNVECPGL